MLGTCCPRAIREICVGSSPVAAASPRIDMERERRMRARFAPRNVAASWLEITVLMPYSVAKHLQLATNPSSQAARQTPTRAGRLRIHPTFTASVYSTEADTCPGRVFSHAARANRTVHPRGLEPLTFGSVVRSCQDFAEKRHVRRGRNADRCLRFFSTRCGFFENCGFSRGNCAQIAQVSCSRKKQPS